MTTRARILMLAPEPFFQPRGTPFSEYHRIKTLGELGYEIDLITYPFGQDVDLPRLQIIRSSRPPFVRDVPIGPSKTKAALDLLLTLTAVRHVATTRYDAIHSHEEAGVLGVWLARWKGIPHLYDMHSSLPQQLDNFGYSRSVLIRRVFEWAEGVMVRDSRVIITICQELQDAVVSAGAGERSFLIENVMGGEFTESPLDAPEDLDVRGQHGIGSSAPLVVYTGTFEAYQGLDLLMDAARRLAMTHPDARLLIVGGEPGQVDEARRRAPRETVIFTGQRKPDQVPAFVRAADILVSPRVSGTNTPLKIYSYLRSGRPIVATRLRTHTQVLDDEIAVLVRPEPAPLAEAIGRLIDRPNERARLAEAARVRAATRYGRDRYVARTAEAYVRLLAGTSAADQPAPDAWRSEAS